MERDTRGISSAGVVLPLSEAGFSGKGGAGLDDKEVREADTEVRGSDASVLLLNLEGNGGL